MNCDILKSKLIFCEWNAFYFIEIAFIGFTLDEIKQCIVFFGTPGIYIYIFILDIDNFSVHCTCYAKLMFATILGHVYKFKFRFKT